MNNNPDKEDVRIGVTGHRFLSRIDLLQKGIREALKNLGERYPCAPFVVVSALAQGADRLLVNEIQTWSKSRGQSRRLIAALPIEPDEYEKVFDEKEDSALAFQLKKEFRRYLDFSDEVIITYKGGTLDEAYRENGNFIADNCDVLFALWDGEEAQGIGGTAEVVKRAKDRGVPVYVIHSGNRKQGTEEVTVHKDQGKVLILRP